MRKLFVIQIVIVYLLLFFFFFITDNCQFFVLTGKLYKSRVCFIKHLWEHTIYWDLFAGDKNHMRVLSIQAALILYGASRQSLRQPVTVDSLLVTSPHCQEHNVKEAKDSVINDVTSTFHSEETLGFVTSSTDVVSGVPESSTNSSSIMITDVLAVRNTFVQNQSAPSCNSLSQSLHISDCNSFSQHLPTTPVKPRKIQSIPSTPLKRHPGSFSKMSRKLLKKGRHLDSGSRVSLGQSPNPVRAGRFFVPSTDRNTDELYWKEADTSPYKRKRSE